MRNLQAPLFVLFPFLVGCASTPIYKEAQISMGTVVEIQIPQTGPNSALLSQAVQAAFTAVHDVDRKMSVYRPDSEISRINQNAGHHTIPVSHETYDLLRRSSRLSEETNGCFDVTVGPLVKLWGFQREGASGPKPSDIDIAEAKSHVGYQKIIFDDKTYTVGFRSPGSEVDLGGIAKGFAVDQAIEVLRERGIQNAFVAASGDIFCLGRPSPDRFWQVGIRHPFRKDETVAFLELSDQAISTSGIYENFFSQDGKKWNHLIDPKTGYPVQHSLVSATVVAPYSWLADALATAFMVCGKDEAERLMRGLDGIEAVFIDGSPQRLKISYTEGLKHRIMIREE